MKKLLPFAIALIPVTIIGFNAIWDFSIERYIFSYFTEAVPRSRNPFIIIKLILHELVMVLYIIAPIIFFASPNPKWKEASVYVLRAFFIINIMFNIPFVAFSLYTNQPDWDNAGGYFAVIRSILNVLICIVLWNAKPYGSIPRINISDYPLVDHSTRMERSVHHIIDLLFLMAISDRWYVFMTSILSFSIETAALIFTLVFVYFFYFLLSETLLGQTPGQSLTNSCPVGTTSKMGIRKAFIRSICRLIPLGGLSFLWGGNWHDRISGTTVVHRNSWQDLPFEAERQ